MNSESMLEKALILSEALPYMQAFSGKQCIVKYGGSVMKDPGLAKRVAKDVVLLQQVGIKPIVVHGGGPEINKFLQLMGNIKIEFVDGQRVTNAEVLEVVEAVLCGLVNKRIVQEINKAGGRAVGISGKDDDFIIARKYKAIGSKGNEIDLGYVGMPSRINRRIIDDLHSNGMIPVVAPVCAGEDYSTYNVNSDTVAGFIAKELQVEKMVMLTDICGVLDSDSQLLTQLTVSQARNLIASGIISGGMIPKVKNCIDMVSNVGGKAHILDGRVPHVMLLELFTIHGSGTMITSD